MVLLQVLSVMANAASPVFETEAMIRSEVPVFLIVIFLTAEVLPTVRVPKLIDIGDADILEGHRLLLDLQ